MPGLSLPSPSLLLLAAGMGSRYGGAKQLQAVGPHGETLMDYSVFDALRSGFERIIIVTRAAERTRPWGTGQAVWAARRVIDGPFAVLNADDYYGHQAIDEIGRFLYSSAETGAGHWAVAGYPLARTLSRAGGVNRALCQADAEGWLEHLVEIRDIVADRRGGGIGMYHGAPMLLAGDDPVSMNLWGFTPSVIDRLEEGFATFLADGPAHDAEFYLPDAISGLVREGAARVRLLRTDSPWCGLSHPADRPAVEQTIRRLINEGVYPEQLPR